MPLHVQFVAASVEQEWGEHAVAEEAPRDPKNTLFPPVQGGRSRARGP